MEEIFWSVMPVVVVVGLGYAAVRFDYVSQAANEGVTKFVFVVALPALIFSNLAHSNIAGNLQFIWKIIAAYYLGALAIMVLGIAVAHFAFRMGKAEQNIFAVGASHSNLILLGVPSVMILMSSKLGTTMPMLLVVGSHAMLMAILLTLVSHVRAGKAGNAPKAIWTSVVNQAKNPIFIALALGVIYSLFIQEQYKLPGTVNSILEILSDAVLPASLFGLGGMMVRYKIGSQVPQAAAISALKLAAFPFVVWLLANQLFGLNNWAWIAAMLAAMPVGFNMHNMASRSQQGAALASTTTALSTILSVIAVIALLHIR